MSHLSGDDEYDDPSIADDVRVLRRIHPTLVVFGDGGPRPQSGAFDNSPDGTGTSVDIWEADWGPGDTLRDHEGFYLVQLTVGDLRQNELGICRFPLENNPHHAHIQGRKTSSRKRRLARAAKWVGDLPAQR